MFTIGLTGGIGSGKSSVAACFVQLGVPVIDTDEIARELTSPGAPALEAIRDAFGDGVFLPDGALDRDALRRRIFADPRGRHQLEDILHPRIRRAVLDALTQVSAPYAVIVVPLLIETGAYRDVVNRVLVVDCPEAVQVERVMARNGLARSEVDAILAAQVTREARLDAADDVLENVGAQDALLPEVMRLHQRYLAAAAAFPP